VNKREVIGVLWIDSNFEMHEREELEGMPTVTFGVIVERNKKTLVIGSELFADGSTRQLTAIPRMSVVQVFHFGPVPQAEAIVNSLYFDRERYTGEAKRSPPSRHSRQAGVLTQPANGA